MLHSPHSSRASVSPQWDSLEGGRGQSSSTRGPPQPRDLAPALKPPPGPGRFWNPELGGPMGATPYLAEPKARQHPVGAPCSPDTLLGTGTRGLGRAG